MRVRTEIRMELAKWRGINEIKEKEYSVICYYHNVNV